MMRLFLSFILMMFVWSGGQARANNIDPNFTAFGEWPVLHDGRVKTFESLARSTLYQISGQTSVNGMDAIEWLAVTLFDPSIAVNVPVIRVEKQNMIALPDRSTRYYSLNEMMIAMRPLQDMVMAMQLVEISKLSANQKEILAVYNAMVTYTQLVQSLGVVLPLAGDGQSYIDGGGNKPQRALLKDAGADNVLLRFVPDDTNPSLPMITAWEAHLQQSDTLILNDLKQMAMAWNDGNYDAWSDISVTIKNKLMTHNKSTLSLNLESFYVAIDPMFWAMVAYALGALVLMKFHAVGLVIIGAGGLLHLGGLIVRSMILMRPPTGTVYETFLFAAMAIVLVSTIIFWLNKNRLVLSSCIASAVFLLFISRGFIGGDSLSVLVAVLNTNFWLSTHVTCIIIGYALCVMAAVIGHLYLVTNNRTIQKMIIPMALIALLFTAIGTLLGGIWADQSWGRFWGWDPKENGALLITLWLVWVLHGRISGHFNMVQLAAALGLTNIAVALTWFGVNLLGVGLHSYGFMAGIAYGLIAFCVTQIMVIIGLYVWHVRRYSHA